jgi:hypothetical protein
MTNLPTNRTEAKFFPRNEDAPAPTKTDSSVSSYGPFNNILAMVRWVFYRPVPPIKLGKKTNIDLPSSGVIFIVSCAFIFTTLYCFVPQPLYWQSIQYGSPPLAIRSGMIAVALTPWIIAMSMKANFVSMLTGIGHERLIVLHRWGGYLCLFLSLVHTIPFYIQPVWDQGGLQVFQPMFNNGLVIYGTGQCLYNFFFFFFAQATN